MPRGPRIALVHDYLLVRRGAERTFGVMAELWPEAWVFALLYDEAVARSLVRMRGVHSSYLQGIGARQSRFRYLLPLLPRAAAKLPVGEFDLVLSSSSAFAHGVRQGSGALHVCYCHSPFRYAWHERSRALEEVPIAFRPALRATLARIRSWDRAAAQRVDNYTPTSPLTRERFGDCGGRDARVTPPPVEVERFAVGQ